MARTSKIWGRHQTRHVARAVKTSSSDEDLDSDDNCGSNDIPLLTVMPTTVTTANLPAPLPPSIEEAYRKKCIELKRRMTEVEESNDAFRLRKVRLTRAIRKMRLERAYLLETLGKRMKKNGGGGNELQGYFDEESEGSSEGPPTPHEKPLRSKRSHRRAAPSPPPILDNNISHANPQYQAPAFHAYEPRREADSSHITSSPTDGHPAAQQYGPTDVQAPHGHTHSMVPSTPPLTAFHMYLEDRFQSQFDDEDPSMHAENQEKRVHIARQNWDRETEGVRQYYLMQESKSKESHEAKVVAAQKYEVQQQQHHHSHQQQAARSEAPEGRATSSERERAQAEDEVEVEKMDMDDAERTGEAERSSATGTGGFTSING